MARHNQTGKWGEEIACQKLIREGYAIVERNWKLHNYEIDIIAQKDSRVIFVEVKTRSNPGDDPFDAIDQKKIRRMAAMANAYIQNCNSHLEPQFDLIGITGTPEDYKLEHISDAFLPPLKTYN